MGLIYVVMCPAVGGVAGVSTTLDLDRVGMSRCRRVAYLGQYQCETCYMIFDDFKILRSCMYLFYDVYIL